MTKYHCALTICLILLSIVTSLYSADGKPSKPNVIIILADDMGYSDPGCFGGEMNTPNLDRLAREGMRFTQFYNGGMCVVSRSCMLTGNWWPRSQAKFTSIPLISEKLHASGYRTALIGKWHMRGDPLDRGFDHFFGFTNGFSNHFLGNGSYRLDRAPFKEFGNNFYSTDAFTDRAIQFISATANSQTRQPFFLYLSYQAPHNPLQAPIADVLKKRGHYLHGWQAVREARFQRQKQMGMVAADALLPDYPKNLPDWKSLSAEQRDLEDLRMSVYAAMIERMDFGIGRVLTALKDSGQVNNTLILFMSDNGADPFSSGDAGQLKNETLPGDRKSNFQLGSGWAYASVTPGRLYKISQHAGGITTGAIAWWPGGLLGEAGRMTSAPVHMVDVLPTLAQIVNSEASKETVSLDPSSSDKSQVDGESFLPLIKNEIWRRQKPLFFQMADNRAIRTSEWTMAEVDGGGWELFKMNADRFENINLAAQKPEVIAQLNAQWMAWWMEQSGKPTYEGKLNPGATGYAPQGDRGTGDQYRPSAMPASLKNRYPSQ